MPLTFRVGGVPEHFNYPWKLALREKMFENQSDFLLSWEDVPGGTGAMVKKLVNDELDLALLLTEGAIKAIADGENLSILGTYVQSPLQWGIHVPAHSPYQQISDLENKPIAISRKGSGSHLMSFVLAEREGWDQENLEFVVVRNFDGARESFAKGESEVFLWEKFTTKPVVDAGEWRRIEVIPTPWPCFVLVGRKEIAQGYAAEIQKIMEIVMEAKAKLEPEATIDFLNLNYEQKEEDLREWYGQTEWLCKPEVSGRDFAQVQLSLFHLGLIRQLRETNHYLGDFCKIT